MTKKNAWNKVYEETEKTYKVKMVNEQRLLKMWLSLHSLE